MAAVAPVQPVIYTVLDGMILCGVNNTANFIGQTPAERFANDIFMGTFESMRDKSFEELDADFKSYSDLTQLQGQIRILPMVKRNIKALVHWSQGQYRMGLNPQDSAFPIADVTILLRNQKSHAIFITKSKMIVNNAKPSNFDDKTKWEDWKPTFVNFLRSIPGRDGTPLSYTIRHNDTPDPTKNPDFLDDYVAMAPLTGPSFIVDASEVHTYIVSFTAGNSTAEAKMKHHAHKNNGRLDFTALSEHYEGVGVNSIDILRADSILEKLFYQGEKKPHMWWEQFEIDLDFAFNAYSRAEGHDIHSENMKLRILTKKVTADFLGMTKASIMTQMTAIPMNMTYIQALATFRQEVNRKFPPSMGSRNITRRAQQIQGGYRGRGRGFRGRGPRGRGRNGGRGTKRKTNSRHPNSYPVTLTDGTVMDVHASYWFGPEIWNKLPPNEQTRINNDRNEYKRQKSNRNLATLNMMPQMPYNQQQGIVPWTPQYNPQYQVQSLNHQPPPSWSLPPYPGAQHIPPPPPPTPSSQPLSNSGGTTMMGGRNERALNSNRHNQGGGQ